MSYPLLRSFLFSRKNKPLPFRPLYQIVLSILMVSLLSSSALADVTVEFVLDGSGSMWGQLFNEYKIVIQKNAIEKFLEDAPEDIRFGVRAFGLPGGEGCSNTTLLLKPSLNAEQEVLRAAKRMNPTGQAPIIFALRKGLKDMESFEGEKVLILIADGGDSCETDMPGAIEKLSLAISTEEIHVVGLDLKAGQERSDLKLLAAKANGSFSTASNRTELSRRIHKIVSQAVKEEKRRLRLLAEEEARMTALAGKTRLVVDFDSRISGFFCSGIRLLELKIDGKHIEGIDGNDASCSGVVRIFEQPVPTGEHTVSLTYSKDNHGDVIRSRPETFTVQVEPGKTTRLQCVTEGHLFYWGLESKVVLESSKETE
jgi:Mg-chelatase subunit ChlD